MENPMSETVLLQVDRQNPPNAIGSSPWQNSPFGTSQQNLNQGARAAFRPIQIPPVKFLNYPFITYLCRP
jgi:hypothetical protein